MYSLNAGGSFTAAYRLPRGVRYRYVKFKVSYQQAVAGATYHEFFSQAYPVGKP